MGLRNNLKKNYINTMKRKNLLLKNILNFFSNKILGDQMITYNIKPQNAETLDQYNKETAAQIVELITQCGVDYIVENMEELIGNLRVLVPEPRKTGKTLEDLNKHLERNAEINPYRKGESVHSLYAPSMYFVSTSSDFFIIRYVYGVESLYDLVVESDIDVLRGYGIPLEAE